VKNKGRESDKETVLDFRTTEQNKSPHHAEKL
jgi:hypothetical protein